jgi:N-methylhydantoinase B
VKRDLARGYITAKTAARDYGMTEHEIDAVQTAVAKGEMLT